MSFFLGIDGGGSKTECVLADEAGAVLARAAGGGTNLRRVSPAELRATITDCCEQLRHAAGLRALPLEGVGAGFAGAGDARARAMAHEVLAELLQPRRLTVVGDMEAALEAAVGAGRGVVLVAGTGSIAYGRNNLGQQARAGGEGPARGDAGSGFDIGRRAVEAVRRAQDSRGPATRLGESLFAGLEASRVEDLEAKVGAESAAELAALVPGVVAAARAGDAVARGILEEAGGALAGLAVEVLRQLGLLDTDVRVATTGGVFAEAEEILLEVQKQVRAAAPRARVEPLEASPAEGAVRLAQRLWLEEQPGRAAQP